MAPQADEGGGLQSVKSDRSKEEVPLVHRVVVPPRGGVVKEVGRGLWETFLYDAPVNQFRGQSRRKKSWLGLQYVFPILSWIKSYTPHMFFGDLVAGLTIASLAIPQVHTLRRFPAHSHKLQLAKSPAPLTACLYIRTSHCLVAYSSIALHSSIRCLFPEQDSSNFIILSRNTK